MRYIAAPPNMPLAQYPPVVAKKAKPIRPPRIYGSEANARKAIARYLSSGDELLDQAIGVQARVDEAAQRDRSPLVEWAIEAEWVKDTRRWFAKARTSLGKYFQDQMLEALPVITFGLPPDTGKPRHHIGLENGVPWLNHALVELRAVQDALGVARDVARTASVPARFEELHASGLVAANVIDDRSKEMLAPRTQKQLADAIGAAKELTEATLRAALDRLGETYAARDELALLMKRWRKAVSVSAPPDPQGGRLLDNAQSSLANLVGFLSEWRNAYGSGHGRPRYPRGLSGRHARLATDAADTCIRFIVTTMDDLQRLPPPRH